MLSGKVYKEERIMIMELFSIIIPLIIVGVLLWAVITYIPMAPPFPKIITIVVLIIVMLWLLRVFGVVAYLPIK